MANAEPKPSPQEKAILWLLSSFSLLTALFTALGATSGGPVDRMLRHHPTLALIGVGLTIVAISLAVSVYLIGDEGKRRPLLWAGIASVTLGSLILAALPMKVSYASERPSVRAVLEREGGPSLEATVKSTGLRSDDEFWVAVTGLGARSTRRGNGRIIYRIESIYSSRTGPDRAGLAELTFTLPLPPCHWCLGGSAR